MQITNTRPAPLQRIRNFGLRPSTIFFLILPKRFPLSENVEIVKASYKGVYPGSISMTYGNPIHWCFFAVAIYKFAVDIWPVTGQFKIFRI